MEPFARQPLFQDHQKYGHGTGHGIGYFLLVHELPNGIGSRASSYNYAGFEPGMVESIEPGFYVSGKSRVCQTLSGTVVSLLTTRKCFAT